MTAIDYVEQAERSTSGSVSTPSGRRRIGFAQRWLVFAGCVLLWQFVAGHLNNAFFPSPLVIAREADKLWFSGPASQLFLDKAFGQNVLPSLERLLGGWAIAAIAGMVIGISLGLLPVVADYAGPVLSFMRALPPTMLVPVFLVLFHIGTEMQLATIVFGTVWPVLLNAVDGARSVDQTKIDTARAFRTGRARWVGSVVLPTALPKIFGGLRISLSFALILMVVSEMVGSTDGLGYLIVTAQQTSDYPMMWAGISLISIMGYSLNRLLLLVEHRVLRWHRASMRLLEG